MLSANLMSQVMLHSKSESVLTSRFIKCQPKPTRFLRKLFNRYTLYTCYSHNVSLKGLPKMIWTVSIQYITITNYPRNSSTTTRQLMWRPSNLALIRRIFGVFHHQTENGWWKKLCQVRIFINLLNDRTEILLIYTV